MARVETGVLGGALTGKAGGAVFVRTATGVVLRPRVVPRNPRTPAQTQARENLARAVAAYRALTPAEAQAWRDYAATQYRVDPRGGTARPMTAYGAFVGLAGKFLQVTPTGAIPTMPPAFPYSGDQITVSAAGGVGAIVFTASGPNAPDSRTELLLQPLRFGSQAPQPRAYRTQAFAAFAPGALSATLPAAPGWYAAACRFVRADTGQETEVAAVGVVQA